MMKYLKKDQPYGPGAIPYKYECVGHVQKRVGKRLRDLRKTVVMVDAPPKPTPKRSTRGRGRGGENPSGENPSRYH